MLNLNKTAVKFTNFNARSELNGDKRVPAADINCTAQLPNSVLNDFAPGLLNALYEPPKNPDLAEQADPDSATSLRFPQMGLPLDWELVLEDRTLTIDYGLGDDKSNIVMGECKVHKVKITPQNGGTVSVAFQISAHPDEKQAGWLYDHQQSEIYISIEAPASDDAQQPLKLSRKDKQAAAKEQLGEMFKEGDGAPNPNEGGSGAAPE